MPKRNVIALLDICIANYLTSIDKNPWLKNSTWGREVIPPKNILTFFDSLKQGIIREQTNILL